MAGKAECGVTGLRRGDATSCCPHCTHECFGDITATAPAATCVAIALAATCVALALAATCVTIALTATCVATAAVGSGEDCVADKARGALVAPKGDGDDVGGRSFVGRRAGFDGGDVQRGRRVCLCRALE